MKSVVRAESDCGCPQSTDADGDASIKSLCALGGIFRAIRNFEESFRSRHGLCMNEGMLLCRLSGGVMNSSEIADALGLTNSNASKVIKSVEAKGYIARLIDNSDKRRMYFELTDNGRKRLEGIDCEQDSLEELFDIIRQGTE